MCQLCKTDVPDLSGVKHRETHAAETFLKVMGRRRRERIHNGKSHDTPERLLRAEWKAIEAQKQVSERPLRRNLKAVYEAQINIILHRLRKRANLKALSYARKKPEITPLVVSQLLDWAEWFDRVGDVTEGPLRQIIEDGYDTGQQRLAVTGPDFTSNTPFVRQVLNEILVQTKRTQNTFREMVSQTVQRGLSEGDDMAELVDRVAEKTQEQTGYRLRRTVRTAANGGFEAGQTEAYRDAGIKKMRWLSQRDARVRTPANGDDWNHREPDGQTVKVGESFRIPGRGGRYEMLRFPSAPEGSAGNVINCRCSTRPVE